MPMKYLRTSRRDSTVVSCPSRPSQPGRGSSPYLSTRVHSPGRFGPRKIKDKSNPDNELTGFFRPRDQTVNTSYHSLATWPFEPGCPLLFPGVGNPINTGLHPLNRPRNRSRFGNPKSVPTSLQVSTRVDLKTPSGRARISLYSV